MTFFIELPMNALSVNYVTMLLVAVDSGACKLIGRDRLGVLGGMLYKA